jgi:hypothetical protein
MIRRRIAIIIGVVAAAAIGALAVLLVSQPGALPPRGGQHTTVQRATSQPSPSRGTTTLPRASRGTTTLPRATCGSASAHLLNGDTQILRANSGALTCFSAAARGCRSASIEVTAFGVDAGTSNVFTIEPGGTPCLVTRLSQGYGVRGFRGPVSTASCRRTTVTSKGVMLSCAGQDVLIPVTVTVR